MATAKRTSLNLDDDLVTDVKMALLEAKRLGLDAPRSVSALMTEALTRELATLRQKIEKARTKKP